MCLCSKSRNPLQDLFSLELSKAPAPTAGRIRVTMVISFFWERVGSVMDVVEADVAWKERCKTDLKTYLAKGILVA